MDTIGKTAEVLDARRMGKYLVAALCSEVWQNRKRTSLRDFVKAYLVAIMCTRDARGSIGDCSVVNGC